ncbi:secreted protein [Clohesyomyces aquaticus]|uniref:Secreted protein n=1 Tax=Clohesyomyces aquaticus TaxID=1231657 RepID=A0A1Y1YHD5_9PLEO|nr:secreted protein [Clohesyomyces aquaticus]
MQLFPFSALASFLILQIPYLASAILLDPLPIHADPIDIKFQPVMDFDKDSCYNIAAVDASGTIDVGLDPSVATIKGCRDLKRLAHSNAYSRHKCNRGWCAIIYAYYFEMDSVDLVFTNAGHRYDWEHVVVWVKDNTAKYVATSAHGDFPTYTTDQVRFFQDTHAKIVYHKDGVQTRSMRLAKQKDEKIENHLGTWFLSPLVGWNGFPSDSVRNALVSHDFGHAHMQFEDSSIGGMLAKSMPKEAANDEFDCAYDDGSQTFGSRRGEVFVG